MPTAEELKQAQNMLNAYRGNRVLAVTITYEDWMRDTALGMMHPRSSELQAIDKALKEYHDKSKTEDAFIKLKAAFDNWVRAQERAKKIWTRSDRNKSGKVTELHDQIVLVEAGRSVKQMGNTEDWEARKEVAKAEREAVNRLFDSRTLIFKDDVKTEIASAVNTWAVPMASLKSATGQMFSTQPASPQSVKDAATNILGGNDPSPLFHQLGVSFTSFLQASEHIIGAAIAPAKLLANIVSAAGLVNSRLMVNRERYMFRPGQADAALNAIIRLIDRDLVVTGISMAKNISHIVAGAFLAGPVSSAANAVVSMMVNLKLYTMMVKEMEEGNRMLRARLYSLELFNASPLLGCYFLIMADTDVWINFSIWDIGTPLWQETVGQMAKRAGPVLTKARQYVMESKYCLSGTQGFKGIQWEPSWRNNKVAFVKTLLNTRSDQRGAVDMLLKKVG
jgi:hypothetical protein